MSRKRGFIRPDNHDDLEQSATAWGLPDYGAGQQTRARETALNYDPSWAPADPSPVEEPVLELTEEQIELIKQGAYQEGLHQGQEAGFNQGFEKGKEQGHHQGLEEGREQGYQDGLEQAQEQINQTVDAFTALADQFSQPLALMNQQVEKQLIEMVLMLVKEVVHVEATCNPQVILEAVKEACDVLPITGHEIQLSLNPEDAELVRQHYDTQQQAQKHWQLNDEPALKRGDVQIQLGDSHIEYKMEDRIRQVLKNFCETNQFQDQS
ncbi:MULTISPECIES: flagellar assembly protein FliH [unclassified Vibrio]|uniref:Flagellar assembly protein FliH n=1 Tax=Vibrio sp. HB236076 TaxID=3232307 RepID=A0AB39HI75_9VIBR|nr:flagellar assembly protein FliH [Vibrio sp. HB161653]MDP5254798.1 flagellar assembly protein FliH [Vibrio sp. HB161653]